jgi:hypothetical protein
VRKIYLDDLTAGLADLNFSQRGGIWLPPSDIAIGSVAALDVQAATAGSGWSAELFMQIKLKRLNAAGMVTVLDSGITPVRASYSWYASPGESIPANGLYLKSINMSASLGDR